MVDASAPESSLTSQLPPLTEQPFSTHEIVLLSITPLQMRPR